MPEKDDKIKTSAVKITPVGTSGIDISGGQYYEEYLDALLHDSAPEIWDEMRRSDDQVKMLLRVVKNPILSARWFIAPADDSDDSRKIADFVQHVLFEDMGTETHPKSWKKFQRESLTSVDFGYSLFEITNKIVKNHPEFGNYIGIKGLDWRSQKTIDEWDVARDGELLRVRQSDNSQRASDVWMDGAWILHISPEMEGDNYEGMSMLRPIYGNWLRKNILEKIDMIGSERAATGIPIGEIPRGMENSTEQAALEDSLSRFVAHERQYLVVPEGFKVDSLKIMHDSDKIDKAIQRQNVGMAKSFLAAFLELGLSGKSGSWALGSDLSDIFLSGIEIYADATTDSTNKKVIPLIVKQNFGPQIKYPKLKIEGINDKAGKEFAEIIAMLGDKGMIQVTDALKETIHKRYNLPDFDPDFIEPEKTEDKSDGVAPSPGKPTGAKLSEIQRRLDELYKFCEEPVGREIIYSLAEPSVGKNIEAVGKQMSAIMADNMRMRGEKLVSQMMNIWGNAPKSQRMKKVNGLQVPGKSDYKKIISGQLADVYVRSTDGVKKELESGGLRLAEKEEIRNLPAESKAAGASQADLITESQDADLRKNLFFSFTSKADVLPTEAQMEANLLKVVDQYVTGPSIRTGGPNAVANAVNLARNAIFQQKEVFDKIESFIFQNPSPEALICIELSGRVFTKEEYVVSDKLPPLHHHCNSWVVAQISGRSGNKQVSPAGLSIQGTDSQIEKIEKSITL